jgi:hypothetical protein
MSGAAQAQTADTLGAVNTEFNFAHKVFAIPGAYFALTPDAREPALFVQLGSVRASLAIPSICNEFGIAPENPDHRLLELVKGALSYVKEIRQNDSIPTELLTGKASWSVDEVHHLIAQSRLAIQLVSWISGSEVAVQDQKQLLQLAEDPSMKKRVQDAFTEASEKLGLGPDRRQEVVDRIDNLGRELAYIEALRERTREIDGVARKIREIVESHPRNKLLLENLVRVGTLIDMPIKEFQGIFDQVEAQTCEIFAVLKNFDPQVRFIRETRDDIRRKLLLWEDIIRAWQDKSQFAADRVDALVQSTYAFLARNYAQSRQWQTRK